MPNLVDLHRRLLRRPLETVPGAGQQVLDEPDGAGPAAQGPADKQADEDKDAQANEDPGEGHVQGQIALEQAQAAQPSSIRVHVLGHVEPEDGQIGGDVVGPDEGEVQEPGQQQLRAQAQIGQLGPPGWALPLGRFRELDRLIGPIGLLWLLAQGATSSM